MARVSDGFLRNVRYQRASGMCERASAGRKNRETPRNPPGYPPLIGTRRQSEWAHPRPLHPPGRAALARKDYTLTGSACCCSSKDSEAKHAGFHEEWSDAASPLRVCLHVVFF
jgi:hypothetical protein